MALKIEEWQPPSSRRLLVAKHLGIEPNHVKDVWNVTTIEGKTVMANIQIETDPFETGFQVALSQVEKETAIAELQSDLQAVETEIDVMIDCYRRMDLNQMAYLKGLKKRRDELRSKIRELKGD